MKLKRLTPLRALPLMTLALMWLTNSSVNAQTTAVGNVTSLAVTNHSYELPALAPGAFAYAPGGQHWGYTGSAGVASNNSPFLTTVAAPDGSQALFLQGTGFMQGRINVPALGVYRITLQSAQRKSNGVYNLSPQTIRASIDGVQVGEFTPDDINYQTFTTVAVQLTTGNHILKIQGVNPAGGDNTALVDNLILERLPVWSDSTNWNPAQVPGVNDNVSIPAGKTIALDEDADVNQMEIKGVFHATNNLDLDLQARWIMVMDSSAYLEWGQATTPYLETGVITLKGSDSGPMAMPGTKFIAAMGGGHIEIHGEKRDSWTQLNANANATATSITLEQAVDWKMGDSIVIASTDFDCGQAEKVGITSVSGDMKTFGISPALTYMHWGDSIKYSNSYRDFFVDERAEVGLLTRNLKIQGDAASESTGFGGHCMIMVGSIGRISGVELFRMGQKGKLGRYPWHWHIAGDVPGQYIKNCAIHKSFNRVVTVHGTNYSVVEDNVGYDHIGNGYFLEDGNEIRNQFIHNLGLVTRAPVPGEEVRPFDLVPAASNYIKLPATYWVTHPDNDFVGNACGGSEGSGWWFVNQSAPINVPNPNGIVPKDEPLGLFVDNRSHSTSFSNVAFDGFIDANFELADFGRYTPKDSLGNPMVPEILRLTAFKCRARNVWMRTNTLQFRDCAFADNHRSTFFSFNNLINNSILVGRTANIGNPQLQTELDAGFSLPLPIFGANSDGNAFRGLTLYDGPFEADSIHFEGFSGNAWCFIPNGAATKSTYQFARNLTFAQDISDTNKVNFFHEAWLDEIWSSGLLDLDGSLTGTPNMRLAVNILPEHNFLARPYESLFAIEPGAVFEPQWNAYRTPNEHYGLLRLENKVPGIYTGTPIYALRSDGPAVFNVPKQTVNSQHPVIVNKGYKYYFQYHKFPNRFLARLLFSNNDDEVIGVITNLASDVYISNNQGGAITQAVDLNDLETSLTEKYYFADNTLYFKLIAANDAPNAQFGDTLQAFSTSVRVCHNNNCSDPNGRQEEATLADFEMGLDSRGSLSTNGDLSVGTIGFDQNADPFDQTDNRNTFSITTDGDGVDEYVEYKISFFRQVWTDFTDIHIDFAGADVEVLLEDSSEGEVSLGTYSANQSRDISLEYLPTEARDEITALMIRVHESALGALDQSNLQQTQELYSITLELKTQHWGFASTHENWEPNSRMTTDLSTPGILHATINAANSSLNQELWKGYVNADSLKYLKVRMQNNTSGSAMRFFWRENFQGPLHTANIPISPGGYTDYVFDLSNNQDWKGEPMYLELLPTNASSGTIDIDYIQFTKCPTCPTCNDGIQNGNETGIDCGGDCPQNCPLDAPVFEYGKVLGVGDSWVPIPFANSYDTAVVIATPHVLNAAKDPVVTRIRNVGSNSFELKVQRPGGSTNDTYDVYFFVAEQGVYTQQTHGIDMEARRITSTTTSENNSWVYESRTLSNTYTDPVILGQVMSATDTNWSVFWACEDLVRANPPTATAVSAGKHVGESPNPVSNDQLLGFMVFEAGTHTVNNVSFKTGVGNDVIVGVDDPVGLFIGTGYTTSSYTLGGFSSISHAVLSAAGMDGGNGGWPVLYSNTPFTNNNMDLRFDEDDAADAERNHTNEQVAYLAIGTLTSPRLAQETESGEGDYQVEVYPNPLPQGAGLTLRLSDPETAVEIQLTALNGQPIKSWQSSQPGDIIHLPLQQLSLSSGFYLVSIKQGDQQTVKKITLLGKGK